MRNRFMTIDWGIRFISGFTILVGAWWLAQWFSGLAAQRAAMEIILKTNMALSMFLAGLSLLLLNWKRPAVAPRALGSLMAATVLAIGLLTLAEHLFSLNLGIDELLASEPSGALATASPNRAGPPGALSLSLIGAGLLAVGSHRRALASALGIAVMAVNTVPVLGFLYGIQEFYSIPNFTGIALPTTLVMLALGLGLTLSHPDGGLVGIMRRNDAGGEIFRRLFPAGIIVVVALGLLRGLVLDWGLLGHDTADGFFLVSVVAFYAAGLWINALRLSSSTRRSELADHALIDSEKRYRDIVETAEEGIATHRPDGTITYVNHRMAQMLGYSRDEIIGSSSLDFIDDNEKETVIRARESLKQQGGFKTERKMRRKDGSVLWTLAKVTPRRDEAGNFIGYLAMHTDVTERKQAEEALKIKENAIASSINAIAISDLEGRLTYVNAAFLRLWDYQNEREVLGKSALDFWEDPARAQEVMTAIQGRQNWVGEMAARTRNGRRLYVEVSASIVSDDAGRPICMMAAFLDVTERKRAEEALAAAQRQIQSIIDNTPAIVYAFDLEERFVMANAALAKLLKSTQDQMIGKRRHEFMPKEDADWHEANDRRVIEAGHALDFEEQSQLPDQTITWLTTKFPLRDGQGNIYAVAGISTDITERKKTEEALRESEMKLKSMAENVPCVLMRFDRQLRILYLNPQSELYNPVPVERLLGRTNREVGMPAHLCDLWDAGIERVFATGTQQEMEFDFAGPSGPRTFALTFAPEFGPNNEVRYVLGVSSDITERKKAEERLKRLVAELERSNKDLEQFAYISSHDLQEPLRQVASFVDLLNKDYSNLFDDRAGMFMGFITEGTTRMSMLIRDLLAYSRVGRSESPPVRVNVAELIRDTMDTLRLPIQETRAVITVGELPPVDGHPVALSQLFQNLIGNALKFRGPDCPEIRIGCRSEGPEWLFSVQDNGIGFSTESSDRIFEIFKRLHSREEYAGTGIGLSICRRVVELHGGRIWAESEPGKGSTFYFTLPAKP